MVYFTNGEYGSYVLFNSGETFMFRQLKIKPVVVYDYVIHRNFLSLYYGGQ